MTSSHILYAHREDDITTLLDAINLQGDPEVRLVIPQQAAIFQDLLNLKLLKRECEKAGKKLILSTQDSLGATLAKKAGLSVEVPRDAEKFFEGWEKQKPNNQNQKSKIVGETSSLTIPLSMPQNDSSMPMPNPALKPRRGMDITGRKRSFAVPRLVAPISLARKEAPGRTSPLREVQKVTEEPKEPDVVSPKISRGKKAKTDTTKEADGIVPMVEMESSLPAETFFSETAQKQKSESVLQATMTKKSSRLPLVVIGVLVVGSAAVFFFVKPSATVTIYPKEETVEFEMDISGRTDISAIQTDKAIVPLERLREENTASKEFPASGNKDLISKAHGRITVYNTFSAASQALVATTRFLSESGGGKTFRTPNAVIIPGTRVEGGKTVPGFVEIDVVADQASEDFNIPSSRFSIPGFAGTPKEKTFYAMSKDAMTGGFTGQTHVVEKKDIDNAKEVFIPSEKSRLEEILRKKFVPDLHFIDGALAVSASEVIAKPGENEPGEKFTLSVHTMAEALLFREKDVLAILEPSIAKHLASQYLILPETQKISYTVKQFDSTVGRLVFTVLVNVKTRVVVDEKELAQKMASMDVGQTKSFFAQQNQIERADLSLWPFWARHLPKDPAKIKVVPGVKPAPLQQSGNVTRQ